MTHVASRLAHIDLARSGLMLIGIPYHAALLFQNETAWHATVGQPSDAARFIASFIHIFRMPAFFLVSGFLAAIALRKHGARSWLTTRWQALGVPMLFGVIVLNPTQNLIRFAAGLIPAEALLQSGGLGHLWFLGAMLVVCSLISPLYMILQRCRDWETASVVILICLTMSLSFAVSRSCDLLNNLQFPARSSVISVLTGAASGFPFFVAGMLKAIHPPLGNVARPNTPAAKVCLLVAVLAAAYHLRIEGNDAIDTALTMAVAMTASFAVIDMCKISGSTDWKWVTIGRKSAFTVYLVHHPVIIVLGGLTAGIPLHWAIHYVAICALSLAISLAVWRGVRDAPILGVLFGARPMSFKGADRWVYMPKSDDLFGLGLLPKATVIAVEPAVPARVKSEHVELAA